MAMSLEKTIIPPSILRRLYTRGSLKNTQSGFRLSLKNRLVDIVVEKIVHIRLNTQLIPATSITITHPERPAITLLDITDKNPLHLAVGETLLITIEGDALLSGSHAFEIQFAAQMVGEQLLTFEDMLVAEKEETGIPRDALDDYSEAMVQARQRFVEKFSDVPMKHTAQYSFDPHITKGNTENFTGVAQIPLGFAGPLNVDGEHATGSYIVPLATTEGTLVASYNRGIKAINLCGGVKTTVVGDAMQRAPVFVLEDARAARDFVDWVTEHIEPVRAAAEATSSVAELQYIDPYLTSKYAYLRFNFRTGDAAGQNMVGKATFGACSWIQANYSQHKIVKFYLESNFATDKKPSQVNMLHTRGKRVTAEAIISHDVLQNVLHVDAESLHSHLNIATTGAFLSGANNNGAHSANAITAMFIATGQDVANVAESSAAILVSEIVNKKDLYISITLPSLIVATYGGGTSLPTQRECLEVMDCYGTGKVNKLAEIISGVVLAGELSLGAAISSSEWVTSHEIFGRNR